MVSDIINIKLTTFPLYYFKGNLKLGYDCKQISSIQFVKQLVD